MWVLSIWKRKHINKKILQKGWICNGKIAVPTGDVVKDMDVDREEYLFFLLKNETNEFTIGLGIF